MRWLVILSLLVTMTSCCTRPPCHNYPVMGACEFVTDSYTIRQGKMAILEMQGVCIDELPDEYLYEYVDAIDEDDILNIAVYHPTRRDLMDSIRFINDTIGYRVYNGKVDIPDIPSVEVFGLTLDQARLKIKEAFSKEIQNVEVFVTYKDRLARKVELTGLVGLSSIPVDGKIRLYDVISIAHIAPGANLFMSYVVRDGCPLAVDLHKLINEGDMCQNIVMRGGDKIYIANPTDARVMLMGEIRAPQPVNLPYGFMSLREALVMAGGIPYTGDRQHIQVIRGNLECPKIYVLSWEHIIHLPNDSLLLMPGDTVYISEKPITAWNRFIDQLLPSFNGVLVGYGVYDVFR